MLHVLPLTVSAFLHDCPEIYK